MLDNLPCYKYDSIISIDDLNNVSDGIEYLIIGNGCLNELSVIDFSRFVNVRMIDVGMDSFRKVESVLISSMMIDDMIDRFDLPKLTTLSLGNYSFSNTRSIALSSTSHISSSSDVPFSNGHFSMSTKKSYDGRCNGDYTFQYITSSSITSDSTSSRLKNCILNIIPS